MSINRQLYTSLLSSLLITGCDKKTDPGHPSPHIPSTQLSLQIEETEIFTTNPNDYQRQFIYTSDKDQTLTFRASVVSGPFGGGVNSALITKLRTSLERLIEIDDVLPSNSVWKDFDVKKGETVNLTISSFGTFRDEFYEYEIELLSSNQNGLARDKDTFEPNDSLNIAMPSNLNTIYSSVMETGSRDQCDIYKYNLSEGLDYTLSTTNLVGSGSSTTGGLQFSITDQASNPVIQKFDLNQYQGQHSEFSVDKTGDYFLTICSPRGTIYQNSYFKYLASIWEPRHVWPDRFTGSDYEPNDSTSLAYEIDVSEKISSFLELGPEDHIDSYMVKLYPGNRYSFDVIALNGPNRSDLSRLRLKVFDKNSGRAMVPETSLSIGESRSFSVEVSEPTSAIIQLYYQPTSGHESDIHEYMIELKVI